ncbi:hypothetical protein PM082_010057 [Marasmius tenuissimus]|nr:hypothetical protein PM082_010057 [Marasmius tenuissimus]
MQPFNTPGPTVWSSSPSPRPDMLLESFNSPIPRADSRLSQHAVPNNDTFSGFNISPATGNLGLMPMNSFQQECMQLTSQINALRLENVSLKAQLEAKNASYRELLEKVEHCLNQATTQPGSSPLAHVGLTFAQQNTPPPDLSNIRFPTKKAWLNSAEYRALKQKSDNANHGSTVIARDNKNLRMQYVEGLDGASVDGARAATGRSIARALFLQFELAGIAPPKWGQATAHVKYSFYAQFESLFPEISYAKDHWKAEYLATHIYSNWYRDRKKAVAKLTKEEWEEDDMSLPPEDEESKKRKESESTAPMSEDGNENVPTKRQKTTTPPPTATTTTITSSSDNSSSSSNAANTGNGETEATTISSSSDDSSHGTGNLVSLTIFLPLAAALTSSLFTSQMFSRPRPTSNILSDMTNDSGEADEQAIVGDKPAAETSAKPTDPILANIVTLGQQDTPASPPHQPETTAQPNSESGNEPVPREDSACPTPVSKKTRNTTGRPHGSRTWNPTATTTARSFCAVDWKKANPDGSPEEFKAVWDSMSNESKQKWKLVVQNANGAKSAAVVAATSTSSGTAGKG